MSYMHVNLKLPMITTDPKNPALEETTATGMQKAYLVLDKEERSKGFVRPVRHAYVHVGKKPKYPIRPLTQDERNEFYAFGYVGFEEYPESLLPLVGHYWTQAQLDGRVCGAVTVMGQELAETYARKPKFYGATFCCACKKHHPVGEFVWDADGQIVGS